MKAKIENILLIILVIVGLIGVTGEAIYKGKQKKNGDYKQTYCEMVVDVYYSPTDVRRFSFKNNIGLRLKSRHGTNIISDGVSPVCKTTAPIRVVSYSEEQATQNERKSSGKWY